MTRTSPTTERWNTIDDTSLSSDRKSSHGLVVLASSGSCRMRAGHPDQAEADYDKAIELQPDDGWSWLGRGLARKNRGQKEPALADLTRSVALEPNVPSAWAMRGEILGSLIRWDEAAEAYDRWSALGGDPQGDSLVLSRRPPPLYGRPPGLSPRLPGDDGSLRHDHRSLRRVAGSPRL